MKQKILDLFSKQPKRFNQIIKNDPQLYNWVMENTLVPNSNNFSEIIYSAVYQVSNICSNNNAMKFNRFSNGYKFCGPAASCECTKNAISTSVKKTKSKTTAKEIERQNKKRTETMMQRYGVEYNSQRNEIKPILQQSRLSDEQCEKLNDHDWMYHNYITQDRSAVDIAEELGVYYGTVIDYCTKHNFSIKQRSSYSLCEKQIAEYCSGLGFDIITNDRNILDGKECDIVIPEKKLAIEVNGLYWHSLCDDKNAHLNKTLKCAENGYQLIHITDYEWKHKQQIIKSIISSKLGCNKKIWARKCDTKKITDSKIIRDFLEKNHIQGYSPSSHYYGLYTNDNLVMVLTIGKNRFGSGLEIHRYATQNGITIVGGASKLLKYFIKDANPEKILTYCEIDKSNGNLYESLGFSRIKTTQPGYFWTNGSNILSRYKTQKKNLHKILPTFDPTLSETQNMKKWGYQQYWNCGNYVYCLDMKKGTP